MLMLLAVLCPPLAVLATGRPVATLLNIGLTLCFFVPGVLHALSIVEQHATDRRNEALLRTLASYPA
jgi:uncharacterized membrane protein YqaE (UPF0057 family)